MQIKLITACGCEKFIETSAQNPRPYEVQVALYTGKRYVLMRADEEIPPPKIRCFRLGAEEEHGVPVYREVLE